MFRSSNNPGKLTKLGIEVEKHLKNDCRRAQTGNVRSRASVSLLLSLNFPRVNRCRRSLLISLAILRALATECRRDIALLSSYLLTSVESTLASISSDLEVVARVASVVRLLWASLLEIDFFSSLHGPHTPMANSLAQIVH